MPPVTAMAARRRVRPQSGGLQSDGVVHRRHRCRLRQDPEFSEWKRPRPGEEWTGYIETTMAGNPDMDKVSTSYAKRVNLTMRMQNRRFTRLCNGFSKKLENHCHAIALHFMHYNFCMIPSTIPDDPGHGGQCHGAPVGDQRHHQSGDGHLSETWPRGPTRRGIRDE